MTQPDLSTTSEDSADVLVIGAGVAGLYAIHQLQKLGFSVLAFEAGSGVGGTWFWNRYPGCRCDVESLEYSYSFSDALQQDWHWDERYGTQEQILDYLNHVADRFGLLDAVRFNTRIRSATYDDEVSRWTLETVDGETYRAPFCIMATGNLSTPRTPDIPGLDQFEGDWYHTGLWPHDGVNFAGQRVGVIGTGSSGVQMIPRIAEQADHLTVFQRTANFSVPACNGPMDEVIESEHKADYAERRQAAFDTPFGIAGYPPPTQSALDVDPAERDAMYEVQWQRGGNIGFLYTFNDLLTNDAANQTAVDFVHKKIRAIVDDPRVAELLCAKDHPIGTKRLILDTGYFQTYNRDNVTLTDIRSEPIKEITPTGLRTEGAQYTLDAIAFATGFDAMTGAMKEIDIRSSSGTHLAEKWQHGPVSYLGIMVAGLPNMFMITGPQSPGVKSNMMFSIEQHVNWISDCLSHMRDSGHSTIDATQPAEDDWVDHNNQVANTTLYPKAASWYMGANIPGKPRIFMPYVGGCHVYSKLCDEIADDGYRGFAFA